MTTPSFAADTAATPVEGSPGTWEVELAERWNVGRNQNGGVLLATASERLAESVGQPHPFAVTGHFLAAAAAGPATVRASAVKPGRTYATATGELWQDDRERMRIVGAYGDLAGRGESPSPILPPAPDLPDPEACDDLFEILTASVGERSLTKSLRNFEIRVDPAGGWGATSEPAEPRLRGWVRFRDDETVTPSMLVALADGFPPSILGHTEIGWLPTIELTVHVFAAPPAGEPWLRAELHTRSIVGGLLDEDGELWDATGRLVARFRQLALLLPRD